MVFSQKLILKKYISLGNGHIIKMHCSYYCEEYSVCEYTNSCVLLLLSSNTSLSKLPVLNGLFVFALKWKKTKDKAFEAHFHLNLKQKVILRSALSSYPVSVDLVLNSIQIVQCGQVFLLN